MQTNEIDLGLSVIWASHNIGASLPSEAGDYFAWGETMAGKADFAWATYRHTGPHPADEDTDGLWSHIRKYTVPDGEKGADWHDAAGNFRGDGQTALAPSDDAATANWGGDWRMPTRAEMEELATQCTWRWMSEGEYADGSLAGHMVTGPNGASIFLPAAGCRLRADVSEKGAAGYYWSADMDEDYSALARLLSLDSGCASASASRARYVGLSVRPVRPKK